MSYVLSIVVASVFMCVRRAVPESSCGEFDLESQNRALLPRRGFGRLAALSCSTVLGDQDCEVCSRTNKRVLAFDLIALHGDITRDPFNPYLDVVSSDCHASSHDKGPCIF